MKQKNRPSASGGVSLRGRGKGRKSTRSEFFLRIFPIVFGIFAVFYFILLSNGYEIFENRGWDVDKIVLLRKVEHGLLAIAWLAGCVFLVRLYVSQIRLWKRGQQVSGLSLKAETVLLSLLILGPALVLFYFFIKIVIVLFTADPSYWEGYWELR